MKRNIDWKQLEKDFKPFLTKNGRINMMSSEPARELYLERLRITLPWVQSLAQAHCSITERILEQPTCEFCGEPAYFKNGENTYRSYCFNCKDKFIKKEREATMLDRYGVKNASGLDSRKEVMQRINSIRKEKYRTGELQAWTKGKTKESDPRIAALAAKMQQTKLDQFASGEMQTWNKGLTKDIDERMQVQADSMKESWIGREQSEAQKEVTEKLIEARRTRIRTPEEFEKQRLTNLERYGVESYLSLVSQEGRKVIEEKYGSCYLGSEEWHKKKEVYFEKMRQTNLKKYGVENILSSPEIQAKIQESKRQNNSFSSSKLEKKSILRIKEKMREVFTQYGNSKYPFACDIYLPSLDMFIELNYHWTHGLNAFVSSEEQLSILADWESKAENSEFYKNAINVWTERDVNKQLIAEENNLNYKVFYTPSEFDAFVESLEVEDMNLEYFPLTYDIPFSPERFKKMISSYKSYNSKSKFNDLLLPFIWEIFYRKELELWKDDIIRTRLVQNRITYLNKRENELTSVDLLKGFSRSMIHKGFSSFSPMVIKSFIRDYNITSIYDPCGGWGHRLLGAWDIEYWYNDFNNELTKQVQVAYNAYRKIREPKEKQFSSKDAASFIPDRTFDAVFTCPPYYDTEDYDFSGDSKNLVNSYSEWLDIWWRNVVRNAKKVSPLFAYVISEKFATDMNRIIEEEGFTLTDTKIVNEGIKNHMSVSARERLYIYRRYSL